jgi:DNA integrity scanning protein DisA with diadenylate cyclase activity
LIGVDALIQTKDLLFGACVEGLVSENDKVLCVVANTVEALISFDVKETGITQLKESVEDRLDINILDAVLSLSFEIAREGREGKNVGALFVIGDSDNVLKYSRQLIINPFQGHSEEERNILNRENWETMKEFALLDGAFIINNEGIAVSTGRYVGVSWDIYLQGGLGGRHLAAASISKTTKAIAVTVSTSGVVRIFKDGKVIFKVSTT